MYVKYIKLQSDKILLFCKNCNSIFHLFGVTSLRSYLNKLKSDFKCHYSACYNKILARSVEAKWKNFKMEDQKIVKQNEMIKIKNQKKFIVCFDHFI